MSTTILYDLSNAVWTPQTGPNIAPNVPEGFQAVSEADGVRFYIVGSKPYAGWLAKTSVPVLPIGAPFDAVLKFNLNPDDCAPLKAQTWEFDMMLSNGNGNVGNGSGQLNVYEGGKWQITVGGLWTDIPGFSPGIPPPNTLTPFTITVHFDPVKELTSYTGVTIGGATATIPATFQNQPFSKLGWAPNLLVCQVQQNVIASGGAYSFKVPTGNTLQVTWP